jgi:hypothetical protein
MAKVTFEFDYYEERELIDDAMNAYKWKVLVSELMEKHRRIVKHGENQDEVAYSEKFMEEVREEMQDNNLSLW